MDKARFLTDVLRRIYIEGSRSKFLKAALILFCAFLVSFLVAREIFFSTLVFGDHPYVTLSSKSVFGEYVFQGWNRAAYGQNYQVPLAYLLLLLFSQLASYAGAYFAAFNFLVNLSFPLSFIAFYYFSGKFIKNFGLRIFGSAVYLINPAMLTYFNTGGFIWTFAFLPFSLSFFIDLLEKHTNRNLAKTTVFTGLTMWAFPSLTIALIFTLAVIAATYLLHAHSKLAFLKAALPRLLVFLLLVLALNASFLYAQNRNSQSPSYGLSGTSILADFQYAYDPAYLITNFLRLGGNIASPQVTLGYNEVSWANLVGFIIPILAFASFYWIRKSRVENRAVMAMLVSAVFISVLMLLILIVARYDLFGIIENFSSLWTLRNPLKLQLMLAICFIPLLIFSLEKIANSTSCFLKQKKRLYSGLGIALIFLGISQIYVYNAFAFNGYAGLDKTYRDPKSSDFLFFTDSTLQRIVDDSTNSTTGWYNNGTYRGIILPFDHNAELHVEFANPLLYPNKLGQVTNTFKLLNDSLNSAENLKAVLRLLSTKYVYFNKNWSSTGFSILQPLNLTKLEQDFAAENLTDGYSQSTIDTVLPRLYLSNTPSFYSDINTLGILNSSVWESNPVFIPMEAQANNSPSFYQTIPYEFDLPANGSYEIYAVTDNTGSEIPIYYFLDGSNEATNKTISMKELELIQIDQKDLSQGNHTLSMGISVDASGSYSNAPFQNLNKDSLENLWMPGDENSSFSSDYGKITIKNGKIRTPGEYGRFDLQLKFKPELFGNSSWFGPQIFFNYQNSSSYFRLIFHNNGNLELASARAPNLQPTEGLSSEINWSTTDWNYLRITKDGDTLAVKLNNQSSPIIFSYPDINNIGEIAITSENSISSFKDITINQETKIIGLWLLPAFIRNETNINILENEPTRYRFKYNQTSGNSPIVVLAENFDPGWEATIDGQPLGSHFTANLYANGWLTNTTSGTHEVKIYYKYNGTYQALVFADIAIISALTFVSYFPAKITDRIKLKWKSNRMKPHAEL